MELKITKKELIKAITIVETALPIKSVIDSLKGIKIVVKDNEVIFIASKTDMSITYTARDNFSIIKTGEVVIPGHQFSSIVKKTLENDFFIKLNNEDNMVLLKTPKSKVNFLQYEVSSYPETHFDKEDVNPITISRKDFSKLFNKSKHATAINSVKPIVTGINFVIKDNKITVAATDARRIALVSADIESVENKNITIPKNLYSDLIKVIDSLKVENFEAYIQENQFMILTDNAKVKIRLLEGDYPDLDKLIARKTNFSFEISKFNLSSILEKIILISERDNSNLTMEVKNSNLILSSYFREIGAMEEFCSITNIKGTPFIISCNTKFLYEALNSIEVDTLSIEFVDEISAFNVYGKEQLDNLQVISPIVLN